MIGPKVLAAPHDYDLRANLMWIATLALNGLIGAGVPQDWATHMIGHELTARHDIDHARTLALVSPEFSKAPKTTNPTTADPPSNAHKIYDVNKALMGKLVSKL